MRLLILISLFLSISFAEMEPLIKEVLNPRDVKIIEDSILSAALETKSYKDVTTIAVSFYAASHNIKYSGSKQLLRNRAFELLEISHSKGEIGASLFLTLNLVSINPHDAWNIANEVLRKNLHSKSEEYTQTKYIFSTTFAALTLDLKSTEVKDVNFALEVLEEMEEETPQINLFRAFLYSSLGSFDMGDIYLNKACKDAVKAEDMKTLKTCEGLAI